MHETSKILGGIVPTDFEVPELDELRRKYGPYITEVRRRMLFTIAFFTLTTLLGFIFYKEIIKFMVGGFSLEGMNIVFTTPFQFINLAISSGIAVGVVFTIPIVIYQILAFLKPGLKDTEFYSILRAIPTILLLFIIGFVFGIFIMRWQIAILAEKSVYLGIGNMLDISNLLSTVLLTSVFLGVGFQFPVVLLLLLKFELIERSQLIKQRKWVYLGSFIFTLFLPPETIIVDLVLSLPLVLAFESVLLWDWFSKKRKNEQ